MKQKFWKFRNQTTSSAELLLYGDIADVSWFGDEVTPKQFSQDLDALGDITELTVRINSGGGDVFAAQAIGNTLERHPASVTARLDGLCASAATIVACHCSKVVAASDSTYMIHPVRVGMFGFVDEEKLRQQLGALETIKDSIVNLYVRKTGRDKDEVTDWMDKTSWWTSAEAKEHGFVDEIDEGAAASLVEDRDGALFVNSVDMGLRFDAVPAFMRERISNKITKPAKKEETEMDIKTVDDLRTAYPELVKQITDSDREVLADMATTAAIANERKRLQDIDKVANLFDAALVQEAKYGEKPCDAKELAYRAALDASQKGRAFLAGMAADAEEDDGANNIGNTPVPEERDSVSEMIARAKADAKKYLDGAGKGMK